MRQSPPPPTQRETPAAPLPARGTDTEPGLPAGSPPVPASQTGGAEEPRSPGTTWRGLRAFRRPAEPRSLLPQRAAAPFRRRHRGGGEERSAPRAASAPAPRRPARTPPPLTTPRPPKEAAARAAATRGRASCPPRPPRSPARRRRRPPGRPPPPGLRAVSYRSGSGRGGGPALSP